LGKSTRYEVFMSSAGCEGSAV